MIILRQQKQIRNAPLGTEVPGDSDSDEDVVPEQVAEQVAETGAEVVRDFTSSSFNKILHKQSYFVCVI